MNSKKETQNVLICLFKSPYIMEKIDPLNQVADFHRTFKHPVLETPQLPNQDRASLRVSLLQEELNEFKQAIEDKDLVEVADALCDIQYVLAGAILEFGLGNVFKELFEEVPMCLCVSIVCFVCLFVCWFVCFISFISF